MRERPHLPPPRVRLLALEQADRALREARICAQMAAAPRATAAIRRAMKSLEGAIRVAQNRVILAE